MNKTKIYEKPDIWMVKLSKDIMLETPIKNSVFVDDYAANNGFFDDSDDHDDDHDPFFDD